MLSELIGEMLTLFGGLIVVYFIYVLFARKDDKPSTDSPTMAHSALRELVERAVQEAKKLPGLADSSSDSSKTQQECNIAEHSYEDLLATAILNKVIEKFQREPVDGNSNVLHEKPSAKAESEIELGLDEGVEEGSSSLEPLSPDEYSSDCSVSRSRHSRNRQEPLSLTIEERIEEVTTTYTSDEDLPQCTSNGLRIKNARRVPFPELGMDIIDPSQESSDESQDEEETAHVDLVTPFESWEDNWLFQKKRVPIQSEPVAMLVPSSNADFKALIGDKDAEDTSDLSECSSAQSDEEIEKELMEAINNVVPRSPKISESEMVEDSLNQNEVDQTTFDDLHSRKNARELKQNVNNVVKLNDEKSIENMTNAKSQIDELCNGDIQREEKFSERKDMTNEISKIEEIQENMEPVNKEQVNGTTGKKDQSLDAELADEIERNKMENSKSRIQRTDILLLDSREDTSPEVAKTLTRSLMRSSTTESNDTANFFANEVKVFNSSEGVLEKVMDTDVNGEEEKEDKTTLFLLNEYSKEEMHYEDGAQQESEYTEHYDTATQRHLDSLTKDDLYTLENETINHNDVSENIENNIETMEETNKCREAMAFAKAMSASHLSSKTTADEDIQLATPPRPGTIAEREHKKWENAPPIENNPYSEESIQKRLLERQYSRRSADIPGIHTELPKSNGTDLEVVLEPSQPDIKRFGRDYYINHAKSLFGDKIRKSPTSASSRPDSALSQRSGSTGTDQEQQVSFELDKFEEASLHGSLSRRSCRDPRASPHFAINPLLRLELGDTKKYIDDASKENYEDSNNVEEKKLSIEGESKENSLITNDMEYIDDKIAPLEDSWKDECNLIEIPTKFQNGVTFIENDTLDNVTINPLYQPVENEEQSLISSSYPSDRDSGMDSIESYDCGSSKVKDVSWMKLSWLRDDNKALGNQIVSMNNKRYLNMSNCKYYTFGGIRNSIYQQALNFEDDDCEDYNIADNNFFFGSPDFVNIKFQTFGGIKRSKKFDSRKILNYSKVKLRPAIRMTKEGSKDNANRSTDKCSLTEKANNGQRNGSINEVEINRDHEAVDEDDWVDEEEHMRTRSVDDWKLKSSNRDSSRNINRNFNLRNKRKKILKRQSAIKSLENDEYEDDDWKDENEYDMDDNLLPNLINGVSNGSKSSLPINHSSSLSDNLLKRRGAKSKSKLLKQRYLEDASLKLEPPLEPQVIERDFKTLKELKNINIQSKKYKNNPVNKKLGIRSLSDVTIW